MTPIRTRTRTVDLGLRRTPFGLMAGLTVATTIVVGAMLSLDEPRFVDQVTVDNANQYQLEVELGEAGEAAVAHLGLVRRESGRLFEQVIDPGSEWVLRFSYAGVQAGSVTISRSELEVSGWRVAVPPSVGERLRLAGVEPSAY